MSVGQLSFILGAVIQIRSGLSGLIYNFSDILKAFYSLKPFLKILSTEEDFPTPKNVQPLVKTSPFLRVEKLSFTYPGQGVPVLKNIDFSIKQGEKIAIVGENGSGKSTLLKLLCRFYKPSQGKILVGGHSIESFDIKAWHKKLSVLFQDFATFPLRLRENISIEQNIPDHLCQECLKKAHLEPLASQLSVPVGRQFENGIELSGGQKQRLAISRMMTRVKDADLLLFDEPTSALDPLTEHEIMDLIRETMKYKTSIVISHRLALARAADRILVMEAGKIVENGSHDSLMKQNGRYASMFQKQASYYTE